MNGKRKTRPDQTGEFIRKQSRFSAAHQAYRDCPHYPCHAFPENQDHLNCLFCFCLFYPCGGSPGPGKWVRGAGGKRTWDCSSCTLIHRDDAAARILELLAEKSPLGKIRRTIRAEFGKTIRPEE